QLTATVPTTSEDGEYTLRTEEGVFDVARPDLWVRPWIDAITAHDDANGGAGVGFVEPFFTKYGLHLVFVLRVDAATELASLESGSEAGQRRIRELIRTRQHEMWLAKVAFPRHLARLAEKHVVRLAGEL